MINLNRDARKNAVAKSYKPYKDGLDLPPGGINSKYLDKFDESLRNS